MTRLTGVFAVAGLTINRSAIASFDRPRTTAAWARRDPVQAAKSAVERPAQGGLTGACMVKYHPLR